MSVLTWRLWLIQPAGRPITPHQPAGRCNKMIREVRTTISLFVVQSYFQREKQQCSLKATGSSNLAILSFYQPMFSRVRSNSRPEVAIKWLSGGQKIKRDILFSNLCIIVLYLASLMARWQRVLLIRIARAARESILINTTTLVPCWSIRRHWSRHLPIRKGQMDAVATLAGQGANKKTDSRKIPLGPFCSKVHLYGICEANKKTEIYPPEPTLFEFSSQGVGVQCADLDQFTSETIIYLFCLAGNV